MTRNEAIKILKEQINQTFSNRTALAYIMAIEALEQPQPTLTTAGEPMTFGVTGIEPIWHPYPEEKPKEAGKYFVVREGFVEPYYDTAIWGKSEELEDWDESLKALSSYWFEYDSEWGECVVADVIAWMPIPKYEKEKTDDTNTHP